MKMAWEIGNIVDFGWGGMKERACLFRTLGLCESTGSLLVHVGLAVGKLA